MFSIKRLFQTKSASAEPERKIPHFYSDFRQAEDKEAYIRSLNYSTLAPDEFDSLTSSLLSNDSRTNLGQEAAHRLLDEILQAVQPSAAEAQKFHRRSEDFGNALLEDDDIRHYLQSAPSNVNPDAATLQPIAAKIVEAYGAIFDVKTLPLVKVIDETMRGLAFNAHGGYNIRISANKDPRVFLSGVMAACVDTQYEFSSVKPDAYAAAIDLARRHDNEMTVSTPSEFSDYMSTPFVDRVLNLTAMACEKLSVPQPELAQELWDYRMMLNLYKDKAASFSLNHLEHTVTEMNDVPGPLNVQGHLYLRTLRQILPEEMGRGYERWRDYFDPDNRDVPAVCVTDNVDLETANEFTRKIQNAWLWHVPPAMRELLTQKSLAIEICRFKNDAMENGSDETSAMNVTTLGDCNKRTNKIRIYTHTIKEGVEEPVDPNSVSNTFLHEISHSAAGIFYGMTTNENSGLKKNYIRDLESIHERGLGEYVDILDYFLPKSVGGYHDSLEVACEEAFCESVAGKWGFGDGANLFLDRLLPNFQKSVETFVAGVHVMGEQGLKRDDITYGGRISRENSGLTQEQLERDKAQAAQRIEFIAMGGPIFFG